MNSYTYSHTGLHLTEQFEGCRLTAYPDQGGVPTIGYGHTFGVALGDTCTQEQAEEWSRKIWRGGRRGQPLCEGPTNAERV